ncbi:hypothetical protein [uncultured Psychrobacter sp.]|uniref:hypothetical protein n=1 Tax=uncultured Psychrobacter sp. TaxID=259303 RepID=UPI002608804C|nr:hypothetical protein [uncultured Psychrobacter sp.]
MSSKELKEFSFREQRFSYPSSHAAKRIFQRTSMDSLELMKLLDNGACVNIGQSSGSYRRHLLFFSPEDKFYYVAIQDERNGKIITILPPAYHKNSAWKITPEQCSLAKERYERCSELALVRKSMKKAEDNRPLFDKKSQPSNHYRTVTTTKRDYKIWVQALYISEHLTTKRKTLFKTSIDFYLDDFEINIKEFLKSPVLYEKIDNVIKNKRLFQETIYALCFRKKKDNSAFYIVKLRSEHEAIIHAKKYNNQIQHMRQVLSSYYSDSLALPMPASMKLPRLCCKPF